MLYQKAKTANQRHINAISVASFSDSKMEVDSRFVNLKIVDNEDFIFFSNYNSPKAQQFLEHDQISALIYWGSINTQLRIKAKIKRLSAKQNNNYFQTRSKEKNALAISSMQSKPIDSYDQVIKNFNESLKKDDLKHCPKYWGGFSFVPYEFEFWTGHEYRLNQRTQFKLVNEVWEKILLQP